MKKSNSNIKISWIAVLLWMTLIFYLSAQPATQSNTLSKTITEVVIETVDRVVPVENFDINKLNHLLRKNAHFFAYLVLALLVMNAIRRSGVLGLKAVVFSMVICVLYAISDEIHQIFVPGRSGQIMDVFIDSAGAAVGLGIDFLVRKIMKTRT